jgi:phosphoribosylformylglycinamidine synthase
VYYVEGLQPEDLQRLETVVADSVRENVTITPRDDWLNVHKLEVAPRPGVMNPAVDEIITATRTVGLEPAALQTGVEYEFDKNISDRALEGVVGLLVNPTVEGIRLQAPSTLEVVGNPEPVQAIDVRQFDDAELMVLSKGRKLALNVAEMQSIKGEAERLERPFTDVELEYLAAAWSEHCCHKTFAADIIMPDGTVEKALFTRIKDESRPFFEERGVLSAFHDNSGVWRFYDGTALCIKLETHNSPMNLEPYGGSATGTGGVLRDIVATGKGAKVINSQHMQFLAPLEYTQDDVPETCHTPAYLLSRSVAGVRDYGNRMGVPTNDVSFHTHPNYRGKGSILVGAMGIMPEGNAYKGEPKYGDLVIAAGGKTGRDGLHGATFSSESADSGTSSLHSGAVQIGNAIEEKKVFDAILEASEKGLIKAMTDCGAAGFASAVGEMGEDIGVSIDLANAPLKYEGLSPWEIFLSESQERMVLAIDAEHRAEVEAIFEKHGSRADVLGTFGYQEADEPILHVTYNGETVVHLGYDFIKNGLPDQALEAAWAAPSIIETAPQELGFNETMRRVLGNGNVCSTEPIVRQYDHEVQGTNALKPFTGPNHDGRNEAVAMTPILGKPYGVVEAHGCNPAIADLDPRKGSVWSYVEAMSNYVAVGGNPDDAVIVNNYISASPTPRVVGALSESVDALTECVREFRSPIISGKDSLSSTFKFSNGELLESPYNLIVTVAGKIPDVYKTVSSDLKKADSTLVLVGKQDLESMGGSVYYQETSGQSGRVPDIDIKEFHKTASTLHKAIQTGKVRATQDIAEGGVAATVAQMAIGGDRGVRLRIPEDKASNWLFNETAGCFVVEVDNAAVAAELFSDVDHTLIGTTLGLTESDQLHVEYLGKSSATDTINLEELKTAWKKPMEELFA